jgi:VanZ family protein
LLIAAVAVLAMGVYVEVAEGVTGMGHCRLRDLVPDAAGALVGAVAWVVFRKLRKEKHETLPPTMGSGVT